MGWGLEVGAARPWADRCCKQDADEMESADRAPVGGSVLHNLAQSDPAWVPRARGRIYVVLSAA